MKKILLIIFGLVLLNSCSKGDYDSSEDFFHNGVSVIQTFDNDFEYIANDKDGNMVLYNRKK